MKRNEALQFMRDNSRLIADFTVGDRSYEHRLGNNGISFILLDLKAHGWEIFLLHEGNNIDKALNAFCERTGAEMPASDPEAYNDQMQLKHDFYLLHTLEDNGEPKQS